MRRDIGARETGSDLGRAQGTSGEDSGSPLDCHHAETEEGGGDDGQSSGASSVCRHLSVPGSAASFRACGNAVALIGFFPVSTVPHAPPKSPRLLSFSSHLSRI